MQFADGRAAVFNLGGMAKAGVYVKVSKYYQVTKEEVSPYQFYISRLGVLSIVVNKKLFVALKLQYLNGLLNHRPVRRSRDAKDHFSHLEVTSRIKYCESTSSMVDIILQTQLYDN